MDFLSQELVAGFTGQQVLIGAVVIVVVLVVLKAVFGGGKEAPSHNVFARCACGWTGMVSKFTRRCPKCNGTIQPGAASGASK